MEFSCDPGKDEKVRGERMFGLIEAAAIFRGRVVEREDRRRLYPEKRVVAIGRVGDRFVTVVYTDRGNTRHIITAWPSNRKERAEWLR